MTLITVCVHRKWFFRKPFKCIQPAEIMKKFQEFKENTTDTFVSTTDIVMDLSELLLLLQVTFTLI